MTRFNPRLIAVVLFAVAGYAAFHFAPANPQTEEPLAQVKPLDWRAFAASDSQITAFALLGQDDEYGKNQKWYATQPKFHRETILSQKQLKDAKTRRELRQTFALIAPSNIASSCLPNYRHGLRFEKNGRSVDAMICFSCGQMEVFDSAGKTTHIDFLLSPAQGRDKFDATFARVGMKQFKPYEKN